VFFFAKIAKKLRIPLLSIHFYRIIKALAN
jgi:hypothetical protein